VNSLFERSKWKLFLLKKIPFFGEQFLHDRSYVNSVLKFFPTKITQPNSLKWLKIIFNDLLEFKNINVSLKKKFHD
jgi:hypothetical protein